MSLEYPSGSLMVKGEVILGVDSQVIHIDLEQFFGEHICENIVHECLEGGWGIAEAEEHDHGFKKSHWGDEGGFPLVLFSKVDVVVAPSYVKHGEYGGIFHVVDEFRDKGQWIHISDSVGVQVMVVLTGAECAVFLWNEKEWRGLGGLQWYYASGFKMFFNECLAGFHFVGIERVYFGNFQNKCGL